MIQASLIIKDRIFARFHCGLTTTLVLASKSKQVFQTIECNGRDLESPHLEGGLVGLITQGDGLQHPPSPVDVVNAN